MDLTPGALEAQLDRLDSLIPAATAPGAGADEIVAAYHQAVAVSALCAALAARGGAEETVAAARGRLSEAFDSRAHPEILAGLERSVRELTESLRGRPDAGPEEYGRLRSLMSTREFAGQYQKGLA